MCGRYGDYESDHQGQRDLEERLVQNGRDCPMVNRCHGECQFAHEDFCGDHHRRQTNAPASARNEERGNPALLILPPDPSDEYE